MVIPRSSNYCSQDDFWWMGYRVIELTVQIHHRCGLKMILIPSRLELCSPCCGASLTTGQCGNCCARASNHGVTILKDPQQQYYEGQIARGEWREGTAQSWFVLSGLNPTEAIVEAAQLEILASEMWTLI